MKSPLEGPQVGPFGGLRKVPWRVFWMVLWNLEGPLDGPQETPPKDGPLEIPQDGPWDGLGPSEGTGRSFEGSSKEGLWMVPTPMEGSLVT